MERYNFQSVENKWREKKIKTAQNIVRIDASSKIFFGISFKIISNLPASLTFWFDFENLSKNNFSK